MFKKPVYLALFVLINLGFILTAHEGKTQNPRFTVSGDCVNDNLTGLMWAKNGNLPDGTRTWQGALDYVVSINSGSGLCGYKDWRLPNMNELESLTNASEVNTATWLNTQGFNNAQDEYYWSSSEYAANTDLYAWAVAMWKFWTMNYRKNHKAYVWPVRSGKREFYHLSYLIIEGRGKTDSAFFYFPDKISTDNLQPSSDSNII